jgi:ribosomal 50S subunit-recycling heat shock protein
VKERIQKVLANAGVASRRAIEEMVQQGRVSVNGRVVTELPILIDPESDKVAIDDETVKLKGKSNERRVYLVMNKPKGVYSTNVAQGRTDAGDRPAAAGLSGARVPSGAVGRGIERAAAADERWGSDEPAHAPALRHPEDVSRDGGRIRKERTRRRDGQGRVAGRPEDGQGV